MRINPLLQSDSYKIAHSYMYPENMDCMFDYVEARKGGKFNKAMFFGLQMFVKEYLLTPFTQEDIDKAAEFYNMHFPPMYQDQVFNREMFQYILDEHKGFFPVTIKAVPEGTIIPEDNVLCTFKCNDEKAASCVSFLETKATSYIWYGTTVATNSYFMRQSIIKYGNLTADNLDWIGFALHDFGARGVAPGAQTVGGAAHLATGAMGSDTLEGVWAAQEFYGVAEGLPGYSIPATEHSVMCSEGRDGEMTVARRVFDRYAKEGGMVAMVNDTYDMVKHVNDFAEIFKAEYMYTGVRWVTRPDSGYPPEVVVQTLRILEEHFGTTENEKGYKVLPNCVRVIQGDGIDGVMLEKVLLAVGDAGFSVENVAFGSGGGLLQKVNRDTLRFAMKASYIEVDGNGRDVFKQPVTQTGDYDKKSKAGELSLYREGTSGAFRTMPLQQAKMLRELIGKDALTEVLEVVYENGVLVRDMTFDEVRANAAK
jgi:nicotinamide phosphoribosyltransferase